MAYEGAVIWPWIFLCSRQAVLGMLNSHRGRVAVGFSGPQPKVQKKALIILTKDLGISELSFFQRGPDLGLLTSCI